MLDIEDAERLAIQEQRERRRRDRLCEFWSDALDRCTGQIFGDRWLAARKSPRRRVIGSELKVSGRWLSQCSGDGSVHERAALWQEQTHMIVAKRGLSPLDDRL